MLTLLKLSKPGYVWRLWIAACAVICLAQIPTMTIDPVVFQDEVQIVDYGRTVFEPASDWGMTWNAPESRPILTWSYLGAGLQELAFSVTSPSFLGPRLISLLAGVAAAACALGWLLARKTPVWAALPLSLTFLLDPVFVENYRGGRVDGWVFAACMGACWLLCLSRSRAENGLSFRQHVIAAGTLFAASPFFWANAPMLFPLVLLELFYLVWFVQLRQGADKSIVGEAIFPFALGALLAGLTLLVPIAFEWEAYASGALAILTVQKFAAVIKNSAFDLLLANDPLLVIGVAVSLCYRREWGLIIALATALFIAYQTMVYLPRVMYLLPYLLAMIAGACARTRSSLPHHLRWYVMSRLLILILVLNAGEALVIRPLNAYLLYPANQYGQFIQNFQAAIGPGEYRVLLDEWAAYYAARSLGWNVYRAGSPISLDQYAQMISHMDYVILDETKLSEPIRKKISDAGFELQYTLRFDHPYRGKMSWGPWTNRLPKVVYADLLVYQRRAHVTRADT